ncbi:hypothetical protein [[Actinomadura] parvosata]|uniref:hypothetical protein n=1 Tax=[Actinomadura] parvosata TaxID=1955412 RepID=UPI00164795E7
MPHITAYTEDEISLPLVFVADPGATDGIRLSYADATPQDFQFGVLWACHGPHRKGRADFCMIHSLPRRPARRDVGP